MPLEQTTEASQTTFRYLRFSKEQQRDETDNQFDFLIYIYFPKLPLFPYLQAMVFRELKNNYPQFI